MFRRLLMIILFVFTLNVFGEISSAPHSNTNSIEQKHDTEKNTVADYKFIIPIDPELNKRIGKKLANNQSNDAILLIDEALKKDLENTGLLYTKALIYAKMNQYKEAQKVLDKLYEIGVSPKDILELQKVIDEEREANMKKDICKTEKNEKINNSNIKKNLNKYLVEINPKLNENVDEKMRQRKSQEALIVLNEALENDPENTAILYKKALVYADLGQFRNAQQSLDKLYKLESISKEAVNLQRVLDAQIKERTKDEINNSINLLKQTEEGYLTEIDPMLNQSIEEKMKKHKSKEAISLLDQALKNDPGNAALLYRKALIYWETERYVEAQETLDRLYRVKSEAREAVKLQIALNEKNQEIEAKRKEREEKEKIAKNPKKEGETHKKNEANKNLEQDCITYLDPKFSKIIDELIEKHKTHDAILMLDQCLEMDPCHTGLHYKEASIFSDAEQYKKAQKALDRVYKIEPCALCESEKVNDLQKTIDEKEHVNHAMNFIITMIELT